MFGQSLGMRLRGAYLTFHRRANAHFEPTGLTADQFVVLSLLTEAEGATQRDLAERAYSDANTIGAILVRLEKKRLIRRKSHPHDARARCVYLTAAGRRVQEELDASSRDLRRGLDELYTREERATLSELLGRIPGWAASVARDAAGDAVA